MDYPALTHAQHLMSAADVAARTFNSEVWWRGQPVAKWGLRPGVWRRDRPAGYERTITAKFLARAATRYAKCPPRGDWPAWLFLLQHFRLPTRLLDWSESPLVAAYFAVMSHDEGPATLWALSPHRLNRAQVGRETILTPGNPHARPLFLPPFRSGAAEVARVAAVQADEVDLRMLVQQSAFTIHGCNAAIDELEQASDFVMRFEIPAESKASMRRALHRLGVKRATLFPDLENLALELASHEYAPLQD